MDEKTAQNLKKFLEAQKKGAIPKKKAALEQDPYDFLNEINAQLAEEPPVEDTQTRDNENLSEEEDEATLFGETYAYNTSDKEIHNSFYDLSKKQEKRRSAQNMKKFTTEKDRNPLKSYFRKPGISVKLPSQGFYYDENFEILPNGEVNVFPMAAKDELMLRNPDLIMNGTAITEVIKSCCPAFSRMNGFDVVVNDVYALLLAIQRASHGPVMKVKHACEKCNEENTVNIDLDAVLSQIELLEDAYAMTVDSPPRLLVGMENVEKKIGKELLILIEPTRYGHIVPYTLVSFEEMKVVQILQNQNLPEEEKEKLVRERFERINEIVINFIVNSIPSVITPDGDFVENKEHIKEFVVEDLPIEKYRFLEKSIADINSIGVPSNWEFECVKCKHKNKTDIKYDPLHFLSQD